MLGIKRNEKEWIWAVYGKHPVAKDYLKIGQNFTLADSFFEWVEKGYRMLSRMGQKDKNFISWRFWAKGSGKEKLVCGLLRGSCDSIGRPYPLLIIGTGPLTDWSNQWNLIPFACDITWGMIEYIASQIFSDLKEMTSIIHNIKPPHIDLDEFIAKKENVIELYSAFPNESRSEALREMEKQASILSGKADSFIDLKHDIFPDQFSLLVLWHSLLKKVLKTIPNVMFIGGTLEESYLAFFNRPLNPDDFIHMWSFSHN